MRELFKDILNGRKKLKYERASDSLDSQLDAVSDYEREVKEGSSPDYDEAEVRANKRKVDVHLHEIINTIYNESKKNYSSISDYYSKHKK